MLQRYTDTVIISYDGDAAGQHATFRGLQILKDAGLDVKVLSLPDGLDPDEIIKQRGNAAYQALIDSALPLIDYKLKVVGERFDVSTVDGKRKYVDNALRVIAESDKDFEREELLKKVSEHSRITYESLRRDLDKAPEARTSTKVLYENEETASSAVEKAEKFILYSHNFAKDYANCDLSELEFTSTKRSYIADFLAEKQAAGEKCVPATVCDALGNDFVDELNSIFVFGDSLAEDGLKRYYDDSVKLIKKGTLESQIKDLQEYFTTLTDLDERKKVLELLKKSIDKYNALK